MTAAETAATEARAAAIACLDAWVDAPFSWPLDGIASRGFGYWLTTRATQAWNDEGRATECVVFFRAWLTAPGNVEAALEEARAFWRQGGVWGADPRTERADIGIPTRGGRP